MTCSGFNSPLSRAATAARRMFMSAQAGEGASIRRRLRTTNLLERLNKEIKRRTRVATLFPNEASVLRLVASILMETNDDWLGQSRYLNMSPEEDQP